MTLEMCELIVGFSLAITDLHSFDGQVVSTFLEPGMSEEQKQATEELFTKWQETFDTWQRWIGPFHGTCGDLYPDMVRGSYQPEGMIPGMEQ